ncbi:MAG TPA: VCBS repeat-containing protein, partial [Chthoniobacteraceae bacterium]|nr:VCBS repeat-containing protein [Chthoniobacteraceae bacterium]
PVAIDLTGLAPGEFITSSVTSVEGTSEFSPALEVTAPLRLYAIGAGKHAPPLVKVFEGDNDSLRFDFLAYPASFLGGVRVAVGDVDDDGYDDVITAPGAGVPEIKVFSGFDGALLNSFLASDIRDRAGAWVAAGDLEGDRRAEVIVGAGSGGPSWVRIFDGLSGGFRRELLAFDRSTTGVSVAVGDVNGDGHADIIAAQATKGAHVRAFDFATEAVLSDFTAFRGLPRGGVNVAAGDMDGDGIAEIIVGSATGSRGWLEVLSSSGGRLARVAPFGGGYTGGIHVAAHDFDGDGRAEILVAPGGSGSSLRIFEPFAHTLAREVTVLDSRLSSGFFVG